MSVHDEKIILAHEVNYEKDFKKKAILELYSSRARLVHKDDAKPSLDLILSDLTGCQCMKGKNEADVASYLSLYYYKHKKHLLKAKTKRTRNVLVLQFKSKSTYEENQKTADEIRTILFNFLKTNTIEGFFNDLCALTV